MHTKSTFKQIVRTPLRTALFCVLLSVISLMVCFGTSIGLYAYENIKNINATYTTIGIMDFTIEDLFAFGVMSIDYSPITSSKHIISLDKRDLLIGYSEQLRATDERVGHDQSVIEIEPQLGGRSPYGVITGIHFTLDPRFTVGSQISLQKSIDDEGHLFEEGKRYIVHIRNDREYRTAAELDGEDFLDSSSGVSWRTLIEELRTSIMSVGVYSTNDVESMLAFHQRAIELVEGRLFSSEDYRAGNSVCLVSTDMAQANNLELGDVIHLNLYEGHQSGSYLGRDAKFPDPENLVGSDYYEIIGFYTHNVNLGWYHGIPPSTVFIPQKSVASQPVSPYSDTNLISFRLKNGSVNAFFNEMEELGFIETLQNLGNYPIKLSFYDHGFSKISGALKSMALTSALLLGVCLIASAITIILLANLYVGKQKRVIAVMRSLGVSRQASLYSLLVSVLFIALVAVSIGCIIGYLSSDALLESIYNRNLANEQANRAYSELYREGYEEHYEPSYPASWQAAVISGALVLTLTVITCLVYARKVLQPQPMAVLSEKEV